MKVTPRTWFRLSALHLIVLLAVAAFEFQLTEYKAEKAYAELAVTHPERAGLISIDIGGTAFTYHGVLVLAAPVSYLAIPVEDWVSGWWGPNTLAGWVASLVVIAVFVQANSLLWGFLMAAGRWFFLRRLK
ncbi:hypothetical protein [Rubrivirga sp.]|uniref:hypothetical protein n=1 Tax=Rubrivirga sp. TaxID=1885344 RepID=UPI003C72DBBF